MPPRPILKALPEPDLSKPESSISNPLPFAACSSRVMFTPHVHFPSTPGLTFTGNTHSPGTYDRAPIAVSPNSCALPERNGRVYRSASVPPKGSYFHPRAFEACEAEAAEAAAEAESMSVPPLLPDLSSETDEWDECISPQPASPEPRAEFDHALSFLPHPPALVPDKWRKAPATGARHHERPRRRTAMERSAFKEPSTDGSDGCLGGF
ncbi:hypothetical protein C8R44DRAFT_898292 [Mycena epipterygia]|nr:hypothetical protein C8R44DRAFT_898292 [Mycena epipterygia]